MKLAVTHRNQGPEKIWKSYSFDVKHGKGGRSSIRTEDRDNTLRVSVLSRTRGKNLNSPETTQLVMYIGTNLMKSCKFLIGDHVDFAFCIEDYTGKLLLCPNGRTSILPSSGDKGYKAKLHGYAAPGRVTITIPDEWRQYFKTHQAVIVNHTITADGLEFEFPTTAINM